MSFLKVYDRIRTQCADVTLGLIPDGQLFSLFFLLFLVLGIYRRPDLPNFIIKFRVLLRLLENLNKYQLLPGLVHLDFLKPLILIFLLLLQPLLDLFECRLKVLYPLVARGRIVDVECCDYVLYLGNVTQAVVF